MLTCNIQLAGYAFDQFDDKGQVGLDDFNTIINSFPWIDQLKKYNELKNGCSPTISVTNEENKNVLWISISGNDRKHNYLIGYVYLKPVKRLLPFKTPKIKKWVDIYVINDLDSSTTFFQLFFSNREKELLLNLSFEKRFDSMQVLEPDLFHPD